MANRAITLRARGAGGRFAMLVLILGAAGARLRAAECVSCHEQGQKLEKSAHAGLLCEACHESHESYPHAANIAKPACVTCHLADAEPLPHPVVAATAGTQDE